MNSVDMGLQLERMRRAYDLTVEQYYNNIDPFTKVPKDFKELENFKRLIEETKKSCNNGAPDVKEYLAPKPVDKYLDVGCGANLANYRLDLWPCEFYGVDISPKLIKAMKDFVLRKNLKIGGLWVAEAAELPFADFYFDIASMIGVLEYCTLEYTEKSLKELHRVLKPNARLILDIPNLNHDLCQTMFELEKYLQRPNIPKERTAFEAILKPLFSIKRYDDSQVMLKYFVTRRSEAPL